MRRRTGSPGVGGCATRKRLKEISGLLWSSADRRVRVGCAAAAALAIISSILLGLAPLLLKHITDGLAGRFWVALSVAPALLIVGYALVQWLARCFGEIKVLAHGNAEQRLHRHLSRRVFGHVMSLPLRFHLDRHTGALSQVLMNGLDGYRLLMQHALYTLLPSTVEVLTILVVITLMFSWQAPLGFASCATVYGIVFYIGVLRISGPSREASQARIHAQAAFTDSILNYETVKLFNAESQIGRRFDDALAASERGWRTFFQRRTANSLIIHTLFLVVLGACTVGSAGAVIQGTMTLGDFVLINAYVLQIVRPLELLGFAARDVAQGFAFVEKMCELLREAPERSEPSGRVSAASGPVELRFDGVSFSYGPGRQVLQDINFTVPPGRTVAIVGESGSGKSTLIRLLLRFCEPSEGCILLNGTPIMHLPIASLRAALGVVPQDPALFNDTIGYNIAFGRPGSTSEDVRQAAQVAQLDRFIERLPDGYGTLVGERGVRISGGEKQRIAIARVALKRPQVFVLDEATSSVDTGTERAILKALIEVTRGTTTLLIAHRLSTVIHSDEILVLARGHIVERGTHGALLGRAGAYAALWRAQQNDRLLQPVAEGGT